MSDVRFTQIGWDEYVSWQSEDRRTIKKVNKLIKSVLRDGPLGGEGKPEKLKHREDEYSRRIDDKNRLVYRCFPDGSLEVMTCKGHYGDK